VKEKRIKLVCMIKKLFLLIFMYTNYSSSSEAKGVHDDEIMEITDDKTKESDRGKKRGREEKG